MSEIRLKRILPDDYARCSGRRAAGIGNNDVARQCVDCARRQPVSERAIQYSVIEPSTLDVCPSRIASSLAESLAVRKRAL